MNDICQNKKRNPRPIKPLLNKPTSPNEKDTCLDSFIKELYSDMPKEFKFK